jgi:uncharacterized protein YdhG (YjbR/CyaY superfamily)
MVAADIDEYLAAVPEPKRSTLQAVRDAIASAAPDAEEAISYGMPAFKVGGKAIAGFAAFKAHLAYLPHSSNVFPELTESLAGYTVTKGSLHFPIDEPLPAALIAELVAVRRAEAGV